MAGYRTGQILKRADLVQPAGLRDGEQASGGVLACHTAVAEADFSPLHAGSQGTFGTVVGRLDAGVLQKRKQSAGMFKQRPRQILDLTVGTVQMGFRQNKQTPLHSNRPLHQFRAVD